MTVYVYRLDVTYPEGSERYGWEPDGWDGWDKRLPDEDIIAFRWPSVRLYISRSGANERAKLLRSYGATVEVVRSDPVTWPSGVVLAQGAAAHEEGSA